MQQQAQPTPQTQAPPQQENPGKKHVSVVLAVGLIAVIALLGGAVIYLVWERSSTESDNSESSSTTPESTQSTNQDSNTDSDSDSNSNTDNSHSSQDTQNNLPQEQDQMTPPAAEVELEATDDWRAYSFDSTSNNSLNTQTYIPSNDWTSYSLAQENDPVKFAFMLHPKNHIENESEIVDMAGQNVGSFSPPGLVLLQGLACFEGRPDSVEDEGGTSYELHSETSFAMQGKTGVRRIEEVTSDQTGTYVHHYCVHRGDNAIIVTFETSGQDADEISSFFDTIVSTIYFSNK